MKIFWMIFLSVITLAGSVQAEDTRRMSVQGEGMVSVAPDMATINVGVSSFDADASKALAQTSGKMDKVMAVVTAAGVAPKDIQTQQLSLHPRWENRSGTRENEITGYEAVNSLQIRVRDLDALGEVINAVAQVGANRLNGIQFGLQNPRPHQDKARKLAIQDAGAKAKLYADAAGVALGDIMHISESSTGGPRPMAMSGMAMAREAAPIAEGELTLSASINVLFALE